MKLDLALRQISEIHGHLERSEVYRGYRSVPVGVTGLCALVAAAVQIRLFPPTTPLDFVWFWVGVAGLCAGIWAWGVLHHVLYLGDAVTRRRTIRVVGQFVPSLVVGFAVTMILARGGGEHISLLPGLWAMIFGLGVFASRPNLPRAIGWVALFYLVAGSLLLQVSEAGGIPSAWGMAVTFGGGQLATAVILYWNIERQDDDEDEEELV